MLSIFANNKLFSDLLLTIVDAKQKIIINAHKNILYANSVYFAKLLTNCQEATLNDITIVVPNAEITESIIMTFYGVPFNKLVTIDVIKCYNFLVIPFEHLLDQITNYDELFDLIDSLEYTESRIKLLGEKMPVDYSTKNFPKELISRINCHQNKQLVVFSDGDLAIKIWDPEINEIVKTISSEYHYIGRNCITRDNSRIIIADIHGIIKIYDMATDKILRSINNDKYYGSIFFLMDNDTKIVAANTHLTNIHVYDINTGLLLNDILDSDSESIRFIIPIGDDKILKCEKDGKASIWDIETGKMDRVLSSISQRKNINAVAITSDNKKILIGYPNGDIIIINTVTGNINTITVHKPSIWDIHITNDNKRVISVDCDCNILIWCINTGKIIQSFSDTNTPKNMRIKIAVTFDETKIISGGSDGKIKIWDIATGKIENTIQASEKSIGTITLTHSHPITKLKK